MLVERVPVQLRNVAAAAAAITLAVSLTGCNLFTPQATEIEYDAANGISGTTGLVEIHNAMLIGEEGEERMSLAVTFTNPGEATFLQVQVGEQQETLELPNGATTFGFPDQQQLIFEVPEVEFGGTQNVSFQADGAEPVGLPVQMFSTETVGYETLGPTPAMETPAGSATPAPTQTPGATEPAASETPAPTETDAP